MDSSSVFQSVSSPRKCQFSNHFILKLLKSLTILCYGMISDNKLNKRHVKKKLVFFIVRYDYPNKLLETMLFLQLHIAYN